MRRLFQDLPLAYQRYVGRVAPLMLGKRHSDASSQPLAFAISPNVSLRKTLLSKYHGETVKLACHAALAMARGADLGRGLHTECGIAEIALRLCAGLLPAADLSGAGGLFERSIRNRCIHRVRRAWPVEDHTLRLGTGLLRVACLQAAWSGSPQKRGRNVEVVLRGIQVPGISARH